MKFFLAAFLFFSAEISLADCTARSSVFDSSERFNSQSDAFDWCFQRVQWWDLDTSDGWRKRFCRSSQYDNFWDSRFRHNFKQVFRGRDGFDIFRSFGKFFGNRVFRGNSSNVSFHFDKNCGYSALEE